MSSRTLAGYSFGAKHPAQTDAIDAAAHEATRQLCSGEVKIMSNENATNAHVVTVGQPVP